VKLKVARVVTMESFNCGAVKLLEQNFAKKKRNRKEEIYGDTIARTNAFVGDLAHEVTLIILACLYNH
jgi:hypothetical protein